MIRTRAAIALFVFAVAVGVISLAVAVTLIFVRVRAGAAAEELPAVTVEADYPGATASDAEEKLAAVIEQQINGVEHMRWLHSRCGRDGSYRLEVSFAPGTDVEVAQQLVQNRVGLALPALPAETQQLGITVRKPSPGLLMLICISSRDNSIGTKDLNNFANVYLKNELGRVPGVSLVTVLGAEDFGVRVQLDFRKLAACKLTIEDVTRAVNSLDLDLLAKERCAGRTRRSVSPGGECARRPEPAGDARVDRDQDRPGWPRVPGAGRDLSCGIW